MLTENTKSTTNYNTFSCWVEERYATNMIRSTTNNNSFDATTSAKSLLIQRDMCNRDGTDRKNWSFADIISETII